MLLREKDQEMIESTKIYCRDAGGTQRYWHYEVDGEQWRAHSGLCAEGSKDVTSGWSKAKAKNVGKKNERTAADQAMFEAEAEFRKKLDREYRRTPEELEDVPPSPMLAQKYRDLKKGLRFHPGGYVNVQPKLDGIRMLSSNRWGLMSRDYQPFGEPVMHLYPILREVWADAGVNGNVVFDGELYNHTFKDDFNSISSLVRKENLDDAGLARCRELIQYHVYDVILLDEPNATFVYRQRRLREIAEHYGFDFTHIVLVPTITCDTLEEVDEAYDRFLADGYEGQMIRTNEAYERDTRSWSLMKRKEFHDIDVPISKIIMGNGNWAGIPKVIEYILPDDKRDEDGQRPKATLKGTMEYLRTIDDSYTHATIRFFAYTPAGIPRFPVAVNLTKGPRRD